MAAASSDTITLHRKMVTGLALQWKVKSGNTSDVRVRCPSLPAWSHSLFYPTSIYNTYHILRNGSVKNLLPSYQFQGITLMLPCIVIVRLCLNWRGPVVLHSSVAVCSLQPFRHASWLVSSIDLGHWTCSPFLEHPFLSHPLFRFKNLVWSQSL